MQAVMRHKMAALAATAPRWTYTAPQKEPIMTA